MTVTSVLDLETNGFGLLRYRSWEFDIYILFLNLVWLYWEPLFDRCNLYLFCIHEQFLTIKELFNDMVDIT